MMWTLVQKSVASLDQRFENAQDKLLESLYGTKKVLHTSNCDWGPWLDCGVRLSRITSSMRLCFYDRFLQNICKKS